MILGSHTFRSKPVINLLPKMTLVLAMVTLSACSLTKRGVGPDATVSGSTNTLALAFQIDKNFGDALTRSDRTVLARTEVKALDFGEAGAPISWTGKSGTSSGSVTALNPFRVGKSNCRRFTHRLVVGADQREISGTACQRPGGGWKLIR